jgi:cytochrome c
MLKQIVVVAALVTTALAIPAHSQQSPPMSEKAEQIQRLVNKAAATVDKNGKAAFAEFRKKDGEWFRGVRIRHEGKRVAQSGVSAA